LQAHVVGRHLRREVPVFFSFAIIRKRNWQNKIWKDFGFSNVNSTNFAKIFLCFAQNKKKTQNNTQFTRTYGDCRPATLSFSHYTRVWTSLHAHGYSEPHPNLSPLTSLTRFRTCFYLLRTCF
jgi:hypothetical protein